MDASSESLMPFVPSPRYPDPAIQIVDQSFARYRLNASKVERLATGFRWAEGPVWFGDGRYVLWSDIPNNRIMRWDEETGAVGVFRKPSGFANGNTRDRQGRLVTCEHGLRRVSRTEYDGAIVTVADRYEGKALNSPNDIVCKSDGSIWFTDPPFGILGFYEGYMAKPELATNVYRIDAPPAASAWSRETSIARTGWRSRPTNPASTWSRAGRRRASILAYDVTDHGARLTNKRVFIDAGAGTPDGFRCDVDGNLWCGWGMGQEGLDGVHVFNPDGRLIGRINLPERCANLCFGGAHRNRLFMAASTSLYHLYVNTQGAPGG